MPASTEQTVTVGVKQCTSELSYSATCSITINASDETIEPGPSTKIETPYTVYSYYQHDLKSNATNFKFSQKYFQLICSYAITFVGILTRNQVLKHLSSENNKYIYHY